MNKMPNGFNLSVYLSILYQNLMAYFSVKLPDSWKRPNTEPCTPYVLKQPLTLLIALLWSAGLNCGEPITTVNRWCLFW